MDLFSNNSHSHRHTQVWARLQGNSTIGCRRRSTMLLLRGPLSKLMPICSTPSKHISHLNKLDCHAKVKMLKRGMHWKEHRRASKLHWGAVQWMSHNHWILLQIQQSTMRMVLLKLPQYESMPTLRRALISKRGGGREKHKHGR